MGLTIYESSQMRLFAFRYQGLFENDLIHYNVNISTVTKRKGERDISRTTEELESVNT